MDMSSFSIFLDAVLTQIVIVGPAALVVATGILLLTAIWHYRTDPKVRQVAADLRGVREYFEQSPSPGRSAFDEAANRTSYGVLQATLREIGDAVFELPADLGPRTYTLRNYRDFFSHRALLTPRVNLNLYEAAPNILIGIGLFFTFIFLAFALHGISGAFSDDVTVPADLKAAIGTLIRNASGKFVTSIIGMGCSIFWTFTSKRRLETIDRETEQLCIAMHKHAQDTGAEAAIQAQIALLTELLTESREQVGQLRRFETDFAVAIGKQMGSALTPAFESLTTAVTNALNELTTKVGSMNEDALKNMLGDFKKVFEDGTRAEMSVFRTTLTELAANR